MRASTTSTSLALFSLSHAATLTLPSLGPAPDSDPRWTDFVAPGPGDVRSPCPGLNALANHNFIHHSGKNLTLPHLVTGLAQGMNIGPDFTIAIGAIGLQSSPYPLLGSFDLNDLDQHNFPIEHDGSLSRQDAYFGNDHSFNYTIWSEVLDFYSGATETSIKAASDAREYRVSNSRAINPTFTYGVKEFILSSGETGLYLQSMGGSDSTGVAKLEYVRELFEKERLPFELGWRPRAEPVTLMSLGQMVLELYAVSPDPLMEGAEFTAMSYKDLLEVLVGGGEILGNLTESVTQALGL